MKRFFKDLIKRILLPLVGMNVANQRLDFYKTFIINLRLFGFKGITIFPIFIYKNTHIFCLGKIVFKTELRKGLLRIGQLDIKSQGITKLNNRGTIIIGNYVEIGGTAIIDNHGTINLDGYNRISDGTKLIIRDSLVIGEQTDVGFHSFVMDSDDHFTIDIKSKKIANNNRPIRIGKCCWIGSNTYIKKGAIIPDFTIVASANALITKDYSGMSPYSILGGNPIKLLKSGLCRVRCIEFERVLKEYFKENPNEEYYQCCEIDSIDDVCRQVGGEF